MSKKVLDVNLDTKVVIVGDDETGKMQEYSLDDFNFRPYIDDEVEIFTNSDGTKTMISKAAERTQDNSRSKVIDDIFAYERDENKISCNKYVYGLLAIFFGYLGIHLFYVGDIKRAVKYILLTVFLSWTVIVPLVLTIKCIIDGVKVLLMTSENDGTVIMQKTW